MKLLILDGNSVINRAYFGVRPLTNRAVTPMGLSPSSSGVSTESSSCVAATKSECSRVTKSMRARERGRPTEMGYGAVEFSDRADGFGHTRFKLGLGSLVFVLVLVEPFAVVVGGNRLEEIEYKCRIHFCSLLPSINLGHIFVNGQSSH